MEGSVLSFHKAEWKVSDTDSAHWASSICLFLQFKEISFAYEVLSNAEKRETYDRYGLQGLKEGAGSSGTCTE